MPRNPTTGVYTLPAGNPVVTNTTVSPTWANTTLQDIAAALTASLSIDGSVTPDKFNNDQVDFQQKIGLFDFIAEYSDKVDFLESCAEAQIGEIEFFPYESIPDNYLFCGGAAVSRTTYSELFAVIGTTFGVGDGTTTFNVPQLQGENIRGWDAGRGVDAGRALGSTQAEQSEQHGHTATATEIAPHTHGGTTDAAGYHAHTATMGQAGNHAHDTVTHNSWGNSADHGHAYSGYTTSSGNHQHGLAATGFMDANRSGSQRRLLHGLDGGGGFSTTAVGNHTHLIEGWTAGIDRVHSHTFGMNTSTNGSHQHDLSTGYGGAHAHSFTSSESSTHTHVVNVPNAGGEGRVRNTSLVACIRYKGA